MYLLKLDSKKKYRLVLFKIIGKLTIEAAAFLCEGDEFSEGIY